MAECNVCFRKCNISEGHMGVCGARICRDGVIIAGNYGMITSIALDPVMKKPLNNFHPDGMVLSVGSYGCNLRCPFCQNYEISWSEQVEYYKKNSEYLSPERLAGLAYAYRDRGNIGVAYTYNEPLIGYEYIRDTAALVHDMGMYNIIVTNGMAETTVLEQLSPYIDAMNIDLKGYTDRYYRDVLDGDINMVLRFIEKAVTMCHVELTTLIIPGENDTEEEMRNISRYIAGLKDASGNIIGENVPLHISRFFPVFHMMDRKATNVELIYRLAEVARERLRYVYTGNC